MHGKLSSAWTWFFKYVFAPAWIIGFGTGTWLVIQAPQDVAHNGVRGAAPPGVEWVFLTGWVLGILFILWLTVPLKRVELRDGRLRVSNYLRSWDIVPGQILEVRQNRWVNIRPIRVRLRHEVAGLGTTFTFMPPSRLRFAFWREDPEVNQLRALVSAVPMVSRRTAV